MKTGSDSFGESLSSWSHSWIPLDPESIDNMVWHKRKETGVITVQPLSSIVLTSALCAVFLTAVRTGAGGRLFLHILFPGCPLTVSPWPGASLWIGTARGWRPSAVQAAWDSSSRELRRCLLGAQLLLHQVIEAEWQADQDVYQDSYGQELKENNMKCT